MTFLVHERNVEEAYTAGLRWVRSYGVAAPSRNGPVLQLPRPLITHYERPLERVLFDPARDANPFFHLFEAFWMLAGRDDVDFVAYFVRRMREYSDDGATLRGAYGFRWRQYYGVDQVARVIELLRDDPASRRAVVNMWDAGADLGADSKDVPCNLEVLFQQDPRHPRLLNMLVTNRSNDLVWGKYGANAVHFSVLQEYVAAALGWNVGWYEHVTMNPHVYQDQWTKLGLGEPFALDRRVISEYELGRVFPVPLVSSPAHVAIFDNELEQFLENPTLTRWESYFLQETARPMMLAYEAYRAKNPQQGLDVLDRALEGYTEGRPDWLEAGRRWLERRVRA